jgi:hypothetical protein
VAGAAKAALALRPGGLLAVFWNAFEPPPELRQAFAAVYRTVVPGLPFNPWAGSPVDAYSALSAKAAQGMREVGAFGEPDEWRFEWERSYSRVEWLDQVPTFGGHSQLPPDHLDRLLAGMGDAIDAVGGRFAMGYTAVVVAAVRAGSA